MEKAKIERVDPVKGLVRSEMELTQPGATVAAPAAAPEPEEREDGRQKVIYWATLKGHVPQPPKSGFRGDIHTGPHVDVVRTQGLDVVRSANGEPVKDKDGKETPRAVRWPLDKMVSEKEYDEAVKRAYASLKDGGAVAVGENLTDAAARLKAADKRALDADEAAKKRAAKAAKGPSEAAAEASAARVPTAPPVLAVTERAVAEPGKPEPVADKDVASPPVMPPKRGL